MSEKLEAIHLVALAIDARRKQGTPEFKEAERQSNEAIKLWKKQLWSKKTCRHCGKRL